MDLKTSFGFEDYKTMGLNLERVRLILMNEDNGKSAEIRKAVDGIDKAKSCLENILHEIFPDVPKHLRTSAIYGRSSEVRNAK